MDKDYLQGLYFAVISGTITTLGLIIGLRSGTMSKIAIITGILSISISDTLADGFGLYTSKKAENIKDNSNGPLKSGIAVIIAKFFIANSFLIPVLLVSNIDYSIIICLIWGCFMVSSSSIYLSLLRKENILQNLIKYLSLTLIISLITHYSGSQINKILNK